uniref:Ig-like domain-containing protein n=1 Tax=Sinocyclocheilus rhinocerous TaxID=307959 RepID=A0A673MIH8_9TELE
LNLLCTLVFGVDAVKTVTVMEGDSVTLQTETELQTDDVIMWQFEDEKTPIATINSGTESFFTFDVPDGRFRDRLKLDHQTGSLTITNTTTKHAGRYQVRTKIIYRFSVTVYARLPAPVITSNTSQNPSSSYCSLVCSVVNVSHVTLSWYKGNSLLSSISTTHLNNTQLCPACSGISEVILMIE